MAKDPATVAKKWSTNLGASTAAIQSGVQAVTVAPGQAAARQKTLWLQQLQAKQDVWAANVAAVPLSEWQSMMVQKGIPRIATGATAAEGKFGTFMTKLLPFIDTQVRSLPARGTIDQNITRMTAFVRGMATFKK